MRGKFSNSKKVHIVLEGIGSGCIGELCSSYGINQASIFCLCPKVSMLKA